MSSVQHDSDFQMLSTARWLLVGCVYDFSFCLPSNGARILFPINEKLEEKRETKTGKKTTVMVIENDSFQV